MNDYYSVLGIDRNATDGQIKRSFRRLAMKYHPDRNRGNERWADNTTRLLIEAYKTLTDQAERMVHDSRLRRSEQRDLFLFRMRQKRDDLGAQTRLMLYCLLNDMGDEALEIHDRLRKEVKAYDPAEHLEGRDHVDFLFLIAELYELRNRPIEAANTYEELLRSGNGNGSMRNKFYYKELQFRLRNLYFRTLPGQSAPREAIRYYRRGLKMGLPKKEKAFAHKKIAECYFQCGKVDQARQTLDIALRLMPNLKGIKKITRNLSEAGSNDPN